MRAETLAGHHGRAVTIDLCRPCQAIWFDGHEVLQLAPGGTLRLFEIIGDEAGPVPVSSGAAEACPRCRASLSVVHDRQRATRFEYVKCPAGHGRLMTFYNFLRAKDFIRPVTPGQLAELRARVASVQCANCGAPIDLARETACGHCRAPLTLLDTTHAGALLAELRRATAPGRALDPALPLERARARRDADAAFDAFEPADAWFRDASKAGLIGAGVVALARWLTTRH